jgi:hypothetical protein
LINDLDFSGCDSSYTTDPGFIPIGNETAGFEFSGTFDGNGYNISNLYIKRVTTDYQGLFGYLANATIQDLGLINVSVFGDSSIGGLTGNNYGGNISDSFSTGIVNGTGDEIGGLTGNNSGTINNSYSTAEVNGDRFVGGLTGNNSGTILDSYATGEVNCDSWCGGLTGTNHGGHINNSYATGNIFGTSYIIGGVVGYMIINGTINNSYATGNVSGTASAYSLGGLIGILETGKIFSSYATGNVTGGNSVGGLAGSAAGVTSNQSYATGNVSGNTNVGGFMGILFSDVNGNGTALDCYATGNVNGNTSVGGLMGKVQGDGTTVTRCYSTGIVTGNSSEGGLIGDGGGDDNVTVSFWDTQTSGQTTSEGGTGKTTTEMKTLSTYTNAGWNISLYENYTNDIWFIDNPADYPRLELQYATYEQLPEPTTPGGGGGSGSTTFNPTEEQLENGYEARLYLGWDIDFKVSNEQHNLRVLGVNATSIEINISSEPQEAVLFIGEEKKFELTGDNYYDLLVRLNSIGENNKINLTINSINELLGEAEDASSSEETNETEGEQFSETEKGLNSELIIGIIILVILVISAIVVKKRKRSP